MKASKGPPRTATSFLSPKTTQLLIALPLCLAVFALSLQWSSSQGQSSRQLTLSTGLPVSEKEQFMQLPLAGSARKQLIEPAGTDSGGTDSSATADAGSTSAGEAAAAAAAANSFEANNPKMDAMWRPGGDWHPTTLVKGGPSLAFVTMTSDSFSQIHLWVQYHQAIGVDVFYLFVDGQAARPEVQKQLRGLQGVQVIPIDKDLIDRQAKSRIWNETWLSAFFHKPCNHELFVRQSLNMEIGIEMAMKDRVDWILHIDTDELMYPGGAHEYSLKRVLGGYPADVDTVIFPNYESLPERDDVEDPFTEVTLFKRNYAHVISDTYFKSYHTVARGNPNYFITYGNGKSAARVADGLRPNGAHRWYNYYRAPKEESSEDAAVLHFTYNRFDDLKSRRDRCECAPTEEDAKKCFILPFDRAAFLAASLKTDDELMSWYRERLVWNDPAVVNEMLKSGLFVRVYAPQVMIRGFMAQNEQTGFSSKQLPVLPDPDMNKQLDKQLAAAQQQLPVQETSQPAVQLQQVQEQQVQAQQAQQELEAAQQALQLQQEQIRAQQAQQELAAAQQAQQTQQQQAQQQQQVQTATEQLPVTQATDSQTEAAGSTTAAGNALGAAGAGDLTNTQAVGQQAVV